MAPFCRIPRRRQLSEKASPLPLCGTTFQTSAGLPAGVFYVVSSLLVGRAVAFAAGKNGFIGAFGTVFNYSVR